MNIQKWIKSLFNRKKDRNGMLVTTLLKLNNNITLIADVLYYEREHKDDPLEIVTSDDGFGFNGLTILHPYSLEYESRPTSLMDLEMVFFSNWFPYSDNEKHFLPMSSIAIISLPVESIENSYHIAINEYEANKQKQEIFAPVFNGLYSDFEDFKKKEEKRTDDGQSSEEEEETGHQ